MAYMRSSPEKVQAPEQLDQNRRTPSPTSSPQPVGALPGTQPAPKPSMPKAPAGTGGLHPTSISTAGPQAGGGQMTTAVQPRTDMPVGGNSGFIPVNNPIQHTADEMGGVGNVANNLLQGGSQISPDNTLRGKRIGFQGQPGNIEFQGIMDHPLFQQMQMTMQGGQSNPTSAPSVQSRDVAGELESTMQRMMPDLRNQFRSASEGMARQQSRMGRTGSGLVERDFSRLENEHAAKANSMLGQMAMQAMTGDANRALGADTSTAQMSHQATQNDANRASQLRNLMLNQQFGGIQGDLNRQTNIDQFNVGQQNLHDQRFTQHQLGERAYDDRLADTAMGNEQSRLGMLQTGFTGRPDAAMQGHAGNLMAGSGQYGANSAMIQQQMGPVIEMLLQNLQGGGGQGAPPIPARPADPAPYGIRPPDPLPGGPPAPSMGQAY